MDIFGLSGFSGYASNASDMRALSPEELHQYQIQNLAASQQAKPDPMWYLQLAQYQRPDPRPLDERFADFKKRLAAAIDRFNQIKANQVGS